MTFTPSQKTVLKKEDREYYTARAEPEIIYLQEALFITLEGSGEPGGKLYQSSINAIFSLAYQLKFDHKKKGSDFSVPSLETLWWTDSGDSSTELPREEWRWKVMVRVPNFVTGVSVESAKESVIKKKGLGEIGDARLEKMSEGRCAQILHVGPYEKVGMSYEKISKYIEDKGLKVNGAYHEIYLSDPSRTAPEKIKTIIRIPLA